MHGIQHLFRQHALEKQSSTDGWLSGQSAVVSQAHLQQHYGNTPRPNERSLSLDSSNEPNSLGK